MLGPLPCREAPDVMVGAGVCGAAEFDAGSVEGEWVVTGAAECADAIELAAPPPIEPEAAAAAAPTPTIKTTAIPAAFVATVFENIPLLLPVRAVFRGPTEQHTRAKPEVSARADPAISATDLVPKLRSDNPLKSSHLDRSVDGSGMPQFKRPWVAAWRRAVTPIH